MKCSKFFVIALNICFLVLSTVMISAALTPRFVFGDYYTILTTGNNIGSLNLIWIGSGFVLLAVGIFGLCAALKENIHMLNLYTVILSFVLILKVVTATTSNTLSGELDYFVSHSVKHLMVHYGYNSELTTVMDFIQKENRSENIISSNILNKLRCCINYINHLFLKDIVEALMALFHKHGVSHVGRTDIIRYSIDSQTNLYKCCGNKGPKDWNSLEPFTTTRKPHRSRKSITTRNEDLLEIPGPEILNDFAELRDRSSNNGLSLPTSCCKNKCKSYHSRGCFQVLYSALFRDISMVRSVAMIISVLQIFGILAAYIFSRSLRDQKIIRVAPVQR